MPDFFTEGATGDLATLSPEDSHHALRVLRLRPGDHIRVSVQGQRYEARLEAKGNLAAARLLKPLGSSEARTRITLYQGWPKGDKLDLVVRQAVELGVFAIVPCVFSRCVSRPEPGKRMDRLNKIAREAAMQSGRTIIPRVEAPIGYEKLKGRLARHEQALLAYELAGGQSLRAAYRGALDLGLVIGPEGGFTPQEVEGLPAQAVSLGPRILRTQTAGIAAIAMLLALNDDFQ
ncbi:MAG: 16S rRNA (uracil(1498)-N(3))-methyltransferase [Clostridiales bacterium]|nr:16S rRNA (uracil(1498)-N(3))-methyltransferase [Clostridiales bacterium]